MRFLHVMLRVGDLDRSIKFYTEACKMKLLRRRDYPNGKFTLAFLGYGDESDHTALELTHNWDRDSYDHGDAYGHIALEVEDLEKAYQHMLDCGAEPKVAPKQFSERTRLAFVKDPDGYSIELLQKSPAPVGA